MSSERVSYELQLQAVGRLLDRHSALVKEVCVLQAGEGFVINMLAATQSIGGPTFAPSTLVIEEEQFKAVLDELAPAKRPSGLWNRR